MPQPLDYETPRASGEEDASGCLTVFLIMGGLGVIVSIFWVCVAMVVAGFAR